MKTFRTACIILVFMTSLLFACAKQHPVATPSPPSSTDLSVKTMLTGIDQFDGGEVWGINTGHGTFVVGPEVPGGIKSTVYERLMDARDRVIVIRYREVPAGDGVVAHRHVTGLTIKGTEYRLDY